MSLGSKPDVGFVCSAAPWRNWRTRTVSSPCEAEAFPIVCSANAEQTVPAGWGPADEALCNLLALAAVDGAAGVTANREPNASAIIRTKVPTPRFMNPPLQRTLGFLHFTPSRCLRR
jgi:hypothetical protein